MPDKNKYFPVLKNLYDQLAMELVAAQKAIEAANDTLKYILETDKKNA